MIEFKSNNGRQEVIPIYPRDYRVKKFKNFVLTEEALESQEALTAYLFDLVENGKLKCSDIVVHDCEDMRAQVYEDSYAKTIEVQSLGWFGYHIIGRLKTMINEYRNKRKIKR